MQLEQDTVPCNETPEVYKLVSKGHLVIMHVNMVTGTCTSTSDIPLNSGLI